MLGQELEMKYNQKTLLILTFNSSLSVTFQGLPIVKFCQSQPQLKSTLISISIEAELALFPNSDTQPPVKVQFQNLNSISTATSTSNEAKSFKTMQDYFKGGTKRRGTTLPTCKMHNTDTAPMF